MDKEKSQYPEGANVPSVYYLYVKGISSFSDETNIINYFERNTSSAFIGDKVIFVNSKTCALLIMNGKPDIPKLSDIIRQKAIDGHQPEVYEVHAPSSIAVSGSEPIKQSEVLYYYFQSNESEGGEIIGDVEKSDDESCYIIRFKDRKAVERVCKRLKPHSVDNIQLHVSPCYQCETEDIWDRSLHTAHIPEHVKIKLSDSKSAFLKRDCCQYLQSKFNGVYCSVTFDNIDLVISCMLTPAIRDFNKLVHTWRHNVGRYADKFLSDNITEITVTVRDLVKFGNCDDKLEADIWKRLQQFLQSGLKRELKDTVFVAVDRTKTITLVGFTDCVNKLVTMMRQKVYEIGKELRTIKVHLEVDCLKLRLLKQSEDLDRLSINYNILIGAEEKTIVLQGQPEEITEFKLAIDKILDRIQICKRVNYFSKEFVDFIQEKMTKIIFQLLADAGFDKVGWEVTYNEISVCTLKEVSFANDNRDHAKSKSKNLDPVEVITSNLMEHCEIFQRETLELFKFDGWMALYEDLKKNYDQLASAVVKEEWCTLLIFGIKEHVTKISERILKSYYTKVMRDRCTCDAIKGKYMKQYQVDKLLALEEQYREKKIKLTLAENGVTIYGNEDGILAIKTELKQIFDNIKFRKHKIKKVDVQNAYRIERLHGTIDVIEKDERCLILLPDALDNLDVQDEAFNNSCTDSLSDKNFSDIGQPSAGRFEPKSIQNFFKAQNGMKISLIDGSISKQSADVLVITTSPNLNLKNGKACAAILNDGGQSLQDECKKLHKDDIPFGEIVVIHSGQLMCKKVYLTALPKWTSDGTAIKQLETFVIKCLERALKYNVLSIAFSAIGTGQLQYPADKVAMTMYQSAIDFDHKYRNKTVKDVKFVIYGTDKITLKAFEEEERVRIDESGKKADCTVQLAGINFKIVKGDILSEQTDAIVSGVGDKFEFVGAVAQAIKNKCPQLEQHCHKNELAKLTSKGVAITMSMGLSAKYVIHVQFAKTIDTWKKRMMSCLRAADEASCKSISFPVLGTGSGKQTFKPEDIFTCMFDAVDEYTKAARKCGLTRVRLIVYHEKPDMMKTILDCLHKKVIAADTKTTGGRWTKMKKAASGIVSTVVGNTAATKDKVQELELHIYSDSPNSIDYCIRKLEATFDQGYTSKTFTDYKKLIPKLSNQQVKQLVEVSAAVDMKINKKAGIIEYKGPIKKVDIAHTAVVSQLLKLERGLDDKKLGKALKKIIQWYYEEVTSKGFQLRKYDTYNNFQIEKAYTENKNCFRLTLEDNQVYVLDFERLEQYAEDNKNDVMRIMRKDALKSGVIDLPVIWEVMKNDENFRSVTLSQTDTAYKKIAKRFIDEVKNGQFASKIQFDTCKLKVNKIDRIQNKTLYYQYEAKKKQIAEQKPNLSTIELELWHGTSEDAIASIQRHGFNRGYCGKNGTWYGAGVYFATDASYSARGWLSGAKHTTGAIKGYIFLAKVLTGQYCQGTNAMRILPSVDPRTPLVLYESAVDNISKPMEYVIFNDTQAYPEYIITFAA